MVCGGWGFWDPIAGWDGSVIRVAVSRDVWDLWMLTVAGGGWMVNPGRLEENITASNEAQERFDKSLKERVITENTIQKVHLKS